MFALCTSLLGAMFPLPRILYAMSSDGILFKSLKRVHPKTQTPLIATLLSGLVAAIMALIFNLQQLIDMMSIGTLLAYTIVAICVLVLRFRSDDMSTTKIIDFKWTHIGRQLVNLSISSQPDNITSAICDVCVVVFCIFTVILCVLLDTIHDGVSNLRLVAISVTAFIMIMIMVIVARQPRSSAKLNFKVPFVPTLPFLSIFINLYLMFQLDIHTWIRFLVWVVIGLAIYFAYGISHSIEGNRKTDNAVSPSKVNVSAHTMQSIDDLRNANMEFVGVSTIALNEKF